MADLLDEMRQCRSMRACIDLALTDAYGEEEQAVAWLTCIEAMFGRYKQVRLMGNEVTLFGFDLSHHEVLAVCQQGKRRARITLDSIEFPELTRVEQLWLKAWQRFSERNDRSADQLRLHPARWRRQTLTLVQAFVSLDRHVRSSFGRNVAC